MDRPQEGSSGAGTELLPGDGVLEAIERMIGDAKLGERLPAEIALAEELGVSRAAVRQAMAHFVRTGRVVRYRGRGTFVTGARMSARQSTGLVSVLLPTAALDAPGFYYGELLSGITGGLASLGMHYKVVGVPPAEEERADMLDVAGGAHCSGVIEFSPLVSVRDQVRDWQTQGIPVVLIATRPEGVPWVAADNFGGAVNAVNYLVSLGHRRIACVTDSIHGAHSGYSDQSARLAGYRAALKSYRIEMDPDWMIEIPRSEPDEAVAEELRRTFSREGERPTAVLACGYYIALAVMQSLRVLGCRCPDDVSVVGFDDPESASHLSPALTTVAQPVRLLGMMAAWKLYALQRTGTCRIDGLLPCSLIVRDSCRCLS